MTQRDTLPTEAQEVLAVLAVETTTIVWTPAAIDAYADTVLAWRERLNRAAGRAARAA